MDKVMDGSNAVVPNVGDKGYYSCGTDIYPCTVSAVLKNGRQIMVRDFSFEGDKENGHDYYGTQVWKFTEKPNAKCIPFNWSHSKKKWKKSTMTLHITGERKARQDPNF